jgi:O-methyltransferase
LQSNPSQQTNFNAAMRGLSASMTPAVTAPYDWSKFPVIADIGGGIGAQLTSILDAHPSCRGILFDQPHVVNESPLQDRVERVGGDFFTEIPIQANVYLMRWIIHDWADDKAVAILDNVRRAAPPDARLALAEWVLSETADLDAGKWMDINMLVNSGGRERTASEFRTLYNQAGFELEHIIPTASPLSIIIGKQSG